MGLHVRVLRAEQLFGAVTRQVFDNVRELASAVVALAGISLGIFIREYRARGFEHRFADKILRGNQLQTLVLAAGFVVDGSGNLRIGFVERAVHLGCGILHVIFLGSFINVGPVKFHVSFRSRHRRKAEL